MAAMPAGAASGGWTRRRIEGKLLSIVRLAKASLTYAGGIDYLAWKINRHAGTKIEIKPWQRRWPLIAALTLVPRLVRSGARSEEHTSELQSLMRISYAVFCLK